MNAEDPITIRNPGKLLTLTYVISLSVIAVLSLVVHFMLDEVISEQNNTGKIVNVSGQQRMLSQRASMFAVDYLQTGAQKSKRLSIAAIEKMKQNHQFLLAPHFEALSKGQPSPLSEELYNLYFMPPSDVDKKIKLFEGEIRAALSENGNVGAVQFSNGSLMFLQLAESDLLTPLHNIVGQYEKESLEKVNDLRNAQNVVLGIIILTILVEAFFIFRPMVAKVSRFATKLQRDANFDYLSGLLNRRAFQIVSQQAIAASHRYKRSLSVVMIDIDFFKRINDTHGHDMGDKAIKHVAKILKMSSRNADCVARIGGEEFVLLLPDTDRAGAFKLAEKLRDRISKNPLDVNGKFIDITVSAGVSYVKEHHDTIESALSEADDALYKAKESGRNNVQLA
ncbi:diguanylate cyclase (GGDEF)-like protein [Alteromonas sp. I10]|uniref:diguanylate cyclase n=1 Tax=Alteromonas TaxID=226 RepID=UPI000D764AB2|nr:MULTISPECIES: diguanylate cyclase [Alteromonas]MCZ4242152.1 diguanylate cyclase [Alteromonas macleodii]PXW71859.1 diguanylate cyclase (GGDEF)-like protein [Alteromonas sp. I10]|tara:strand:- start:4517 stop:5701 length:1185 start_codon:yes stop_codon:yes gene_type:complete